MSSLAMRSIPLVCGFFFAPIGVKAQTYLPSPEAAPIVSSKTLHVSVLPPFNATIGLHKCTATTASASIVCYFIVTSDKDEPTKYTASQQFWVSTLIDNNHTEHDQTIEYFLTGAQRKTQQRAVTLGKDDSIWFVQEFAGPSDGVTEARISFNIPLGYGEKFILKSPVTTLSVK